MIAFFCAKSNFRLWCEGNPGFFDVTGPALLGGKNAPLNTSMQRPLCISSVWEKTSLACCDPYFRCDFSTLWNRNCKCMHGFIMNNKTISTWRIFPHCLYYYHFGSSFFFSLYLDRRRLSQQIDQTFLPK